MTDTINEIVGYDPYQKVTVMIGNGYTGTPETLAVADISSKLTRLEYLERQSNLFAIEVADLENYLKENIDSLGNHAYEIAQIFGIELMHEVQANLTFTITATLEVPYGYEVDEDDFQIDLSETDSSASIIDWNVDYVQCRVDEVS